MNEPSRIEHEHDPDGVDEGKRLVRVGGDKGLSLAERLSERWQRLAWRSPIHKLRLRGRHPLKLIAVVDDPFLGDIARGRALLDGMLSFRGETRNIAGLGLDRPGFSRTFAEYLHSFAWLRDLSSVTTRAQAVPIAEAIMRQWIAAHAEHVAEPAWRPDLTGRRILFWCAHAPLILSSSDLVYRSDVLNAFARGARHVDRTADKAGPGAPRIAAWAGVVAAGLMLPGGDPRRSFGEAGLHRAIDASIFADGGTAGRSPERQLDVVRLLAMVCQTYAARRLEPPEFVSDALVRAVGALRGACLGDRGLSSWQGGGPVTGDTIEQVIEATGIRTRPLKQARDWGYQRLSAGKTTLLVDAAPPPVARLVEGGCASTLAFEMSDGAHRLIVNCGGARAVHAAVPEQLAEGLRTTAAHSTLVLADSNSTAIHADGTLGRGVAEVEVSRQESDTAMRLEASHDGYVRRYGFVHRRHIAVTPDGLDVRGEDSLVPAGKRHKAGDTPFAIRFHLGAEVEVSPTADGHAAFLRLPGGAVWQFRAKGAALTVEDSLWVDADGRPRPSEQIVLSGETSAGGVSVSWVLRRAR
ncbi:heparinase II/III family protein [Stakelama saccharophila]|uniref:Heparinase II/III family protein n=1 Tax=Stakelama saccharophila TaxID=3075605 RepID=A0ABZ0B8Z4_9SPHN|nr:heparinase II/III family protein [Stakelama sp. W311]WNO53848.1 heparinase II/III family protein [Stakelama sp. W311]